VNSYIVRLCTRAIVCMPTRFYARSQPDFVRVLPHANRVDPPTCTAPTMIAYQVFSRGAENGGDAYPP
jgi:hypothetical protein